MRTKNFPHNPFSPCVSLEEALAYNPQIPETKTVSPLLNAVLEALERLPRKNVEDVAEHLELDRRNLSAAVKIIVGMSLKDFHDAWILDRVAKLKAEHADWSSERLSHALGFSDNSGLWKLLKRTKHEELINKRYVRPEIEPFDYQKWISGGNEIG